MIDKPQYVVYIWLGGQVTIKGTRDLARPDVGVVSTNYFSVG